MIFLFGLSVLYGCHPRWRIPHQEFFEAPSQKDFMSLVEFFNNIEPNSEILQKHDLSYRFQRIQRLMELDGFSDWWETHGGKWEATLDLSEGENSPVIGLVREYMDRRGL